MRNKTPFQLWKAIESKYGKSYFRRLDIRLHRAIPDKAAFATKTTKKLPKKILGFEITELLQSDGLKIILADDHWILMRPSGTEPLMRLYAESDSPQRTSELLELAKKWVGPGLFQ
jgi:phosphomannomutase